MGKRPKTLASKKPSLPAWASGPFKDLLDHAERLTNVLHLTVRGISGLRGIPKLVEALEGIEKTSNESPKADRVDRLERAKREAELARTEVEQDFPLVHAQAAISLWGALENAVQTLLANWIRHQPSLLKREPFSALRVKVGDIVGISSEQRAWHYVDLLQRETSAPLKLGVNRFESALKAFSLDGPVAESTRVAIFELHQARNLLVHRAGVVDRRFALACPWLKLRPGHRLLIGHDKYHVFETAVIDYTMELILRVGAHFGHALKLETVRTKHGAA